MTWNNSEPCNTITWSTFMLLEQVSNIFEECGGISTKQMPFWTGSADMRPARAQALAVQADATYRELFGSRYESDHNKTTAIPALKAKLLDECATLADIAETAGSCYLFLGESP